MLSSIARDSLVKAPERNVHRNSFSHIEDVIGRVCSRWHGEQRVIHDAGRESLRNECRGQVCGVLCAHMSRGSVTDDTQDLQGNR